LWQSTTETKSNIPLYEWKEFQHTPGIYFEEVGILNQIESAWKLVIELDVEALEICSQQLRDYTEQLEEHCKTLIENVQQTCTNVLQIINKDSDKLTLLLSHLRALYNPPNNKRGLIDAIGTVSKTLFETIDADDEKIINEQLTLLRNNEQTLQQEMKNQLKELKGTIRHTWIAWRKP